VALNPSFHLLNQSNGRGDGVLGHDSSVSASHALTPTRGHYTVGSLPSYAHVYTLADTMTAGLLIEKCHRRDVKDSNLSAQTTERLARTVM